MFPFESGSHMTTTTFLFKLSQVNILMAIVASRSQGFINNPFTIGTGDVAFIAGQGAVFAGQWVIAGLMIISTFFKSLHHVTGPAILFELSLVRVFAVTVAAIGKGHFAVFAAFGVALTAGDVPVFASQRVACAVVIEG